MKTKKIVSDEPQLLKTIIVKIYYDLLSEAVEWESVIERKQNEVANSFEQLNEYISLGIINEHQSTFSYIKNFFHSVADEFEELVGQ